MYICKTLYNSVPNPYRKIQKEKEKKHSNLNIMFKRTRFFGLLFLIFGIIYVGYGMLQISRSFS